MESRFLYGDTDSLFISGLDKSGVNIVKEAKQKFADKTTRKIILETFQDYLGTGELIIDLSTRWNFCITTSNDNSCFVFAISLSLVATKFFRF
jgi:DNA polymerase elongation subunit (family B)